jgi:hypothetical protein
MATPEMAALLELCVKAEALGERSQHATAAEKYAATVAACLRAQQPGVEECLVLANLRAQQTNSLWLLCRRPGLPAAEAAAAQTSIFFTLLPAVMATLERRRVADTLLPGKCRPAEDAWFRPLQGSSAEAPVVLSGVLTYVCTARVAFSALTSASVRVVEPSPGQHAAIIEFVAHALDLIVQTAPLLRAQPHDNARMLADYEQAALADAVEEQVDFMEINARLAPCAQRLHGVAWSAAVRQAPRRRASHLK